MRDPHVNSLRYRLETDESLSFVQAPPIERETEDFRVQLRDGVVTFDMKSHHASEVTARKSADQWLRAWELDYALANGRPAIRFHFESAEVVDRDPPPPGTPQVIVVPTITCHIVGKNVKILLTCREYPEPPGRFRITEDVETLWLRFRQYQEGKEPLASMAYACETLFEACSKRNGNPYNVSENILKTLRRLASEIGDSLTARKILSGGPSRPHTPSEVAWMEAAVKALIRRLGEYAAIPTQPLPPLTMADLPKL